MVEVKQEDFCCGYVTIIGRPNVGKSTLLNRLLGQKISITSNKPQTTRWHLTGIETGDDYQDIYIDTPGLQDKYKNAMNRHMTREVMNSLSYVDVLILMIESLQWKDMDRQILKLIADIKAPVILVINKIDKIKNREQLLPFIESISAKWDFSAVLPVSARKNKNINELKKIVNSLLPVSPPLFPDEQLTDRNERFFAAEFIREKLIRKLGDELPYRISVTIEQFVLKENILHIHALVWVEGNSQKSIVIGHNGHILKSVGEQARKDMEKMFGHKVFLRTWVKVMKNWTDDIKALKQLGYER